MAHLFLKIANTLTFLFLLGHLFYEVIDSGDDDVPYEKKRTYLSAAPFVYDLWGVIRFLFFGFVIWQWLPDSWFEGKDEVVGHAYGWNFVVIGLLNSLWVWRVINDYPILQWLITVFTLSTVSVIYYNLTATFPNSRGLVETVFARAPISLLVGWLGYVTWFDFSVAFTSEISEAGPTIWDRVVVYLFFLSSLPSAVVFTRSNIHTYGDPLANFALGWAVLGVAFFQGDFWIHVFGFVTAGLILIASIEPLFTGGFYRSRALDVEQATSSERAPLVNP